LRTKPEIVTLAGNFLRMERRLRFCGIPQHTELLAALAKRIHVKTSIFHVLAAALVVAGCASPDRYLLSKYGSQNSLSSFVVCKNYGCAKRVMVSLIPSEWAQVRTLFLPAAPDASVERQQVRHAIALMETLVGPKAGTASDKAGADIINFDREGQLDCIDETYDTTTYLRLFVADGLLKWHDVGEPAERGYILDRRPHNTATIIEHGSGAAYSVDSWFHANGEMPETIPLKVWLAGWSPPKA